ncbi:N-acetyl-gamma-glutamyl-phosphate reductase [Marinoscillum pacificum]|uniref:N-acetyl-gamma-glutamyl-phosphate reductase n=1 Tax=Marinoscillum pacificum TaxID=392723 RepID=UPI00215804B8|nr:N-acetyl-gamma-glutamyl-phosphate reductase [Marinoscillum pacificum]
MSKLRVGIYGAAGYTAGELIRILLNHPNAEIVCVQSSSQVGKKVSATHTDLVGDTDLAFDADLDFDQLDVLYLCKGHGESKTYLDSVEVPAHVRIIDLSNDFRLKAPGNDFIYGLPELNHEAIKSARKIANPGCFATCIQVGLLPAAKAGFIQSEIHTTGITGSTGAGQSLSTTSHFSWRNNNMSVYKAFTHQHLSEIGESMMQESGSEHTINFIPFRGNFTRGIIVTSYFETDVDEATALKAYQEYYKAHPYTHVVEENPDLKMVVNTNKALVYLQKEGNKLLVISIIDNLLKGASGQAVQNMNLMFGLEEKAGLQLKASNF